MTTTPGTGPMSGWPRNPSGPSSLRIPRGLPEVSAAVDVEDLAGQEARVRAREEHGDRRDVGFRVAEAVDRALRHRAREAVGIACRPVLPALRPGALRD